MPRLRFTAPIAAIGVLLGVYIAFQLLQGFLTHLNGKPDASLVQILSALTPILVSVLYGIAATAHSRADNAEHRASRIENSIHEIQNGGTVPKVGVEVHHDDTPQVSPGP